MAQPDSQLAAQPTETPELSRKTLFYYGLADMPIQMAAVRAHLEKEKAAS